MRLTVKNIGKISTADILLDGITLIVGENNTGKSTIGKTVFCLMYKMNHWPEIYLDKCSEYVLPIINDYAGKLKNIFGIKDAPTVSAVRDLVEDFFSRESFFQEILNEQIAIKKKGHVVGPIHPLMKELDIFLERYTMLYQGINVKQIMSSEADKLFDWKRKLIFELRDGMSLSVENFQADYIEQTFKTFFHGQYISTLMGRDEYCAVTYEKGDEYIKLLLSDTGASLSKAITKNGKVLFIDTPEVYDRLSLEYEKSEGGDTEEIIERILVPNYALISRGNPYLKQTNYAIMSKQWPSEAIDNILQIKNSIYKIMKGHAEQSKSGLKFSDPQAGNVFPHNVSMGIKHIAFIEHIIRERAISSGDIIILDEPEINLHPEWQVEYARVLVLLEKYLNVRFIITSHSPQFIRAIECFSDIYEQMDNLNIYKSVVCDNGSITFENIMESEFGTPSLYDEYSKPYDLLQQELDKKEE